MASSASIAGIGIERKRSRARPPLPRHRPLGRRRWRHLAARDLPPWIPRRRSSTGPGPAQQGASPDNKWRPGRAASGDLRMLRTERSVRTRRKWCVWAPNGPDTEMGIRIRLSTFPDGAPAAPRAQFPGNRQFGDPRARLPPSELTQRGEELMLPSGVTRRPGRTALVVLQLLVFVTYIFGPTATLAEDPTPDPSPTESAAPEATPDPTPEPTPEPTAEATPAGDTRSDPEPPPLSRRRSRPLRQPRSRRRPLPVSRSRT